MANKTEITMKTIADPRVVVVDLDGTLCNDVHRVNLLPSFDNGLPP